MRQLAQQVVELVAVCYGCHSEAEIDYAEVAGAGGAVVVGVAGVAAGAGAVVGVVVGALVVGAIGVAAVVG